MIQITFTENIQRHVACPPCAVHGETVRDVLEQAFAENPRARGYVLDDRGGLRTHMMVFVNGRAVRDRRQLSDPVAPASEVYVMQALSGG